MTIFDEMYQEGYLDLLTANDVMYASQTISFKVTGYDMYLDVYPISFFNSENYHWFEVVEENAYDNFIVYTLDEVLVKLRGSKIAKYMIFNLDRF